MGIDERNHPAHVSNLAEIQELIRAQFTEYETRLSSEYRRNKVLALLADRASWGWASFHSRLSGATELASDISDKRGDDELRRHPVLVIHSEVGDPLVIRLNEAELADLGPCPNL